MDKSEMTQEEDVRSFFQQQPEIMKILKIIAGLDLEEGCLCAGALRNTIWNVLSDQPNQLSKDLDVIFFDKKKPYEENQRIQDFLLSHYPEYDWDVKNQYYMHTHSGRSEPYVSVVDGISHFPERCTAIGANLNSRGQVELICPYGVSDLICFKVRPTPYFAENQVQFEQYLKRVKEKKWQKEWPGIECQLRYNKKSH